MTAETRPVESPDDLTIRAVGLEMLPVIASMNRVIFDEDRIINSFERQDIRILLAEHHGQPVGFKIGYRENRFTYYSAKGGVLPDHRHRGVAQQLLLEMMAMARAAGYRRFAFDTFPNRHPGMTIMALRNGFRVAQADYHVAYRDFRLRFELRLEGSPPTLDPSE